MDHKVFKPEKNNLHRSESSFAALPSKELHALMKLQAISTRAALQMFPGFTGSLRGNSSAGISNLWGLHVYAQSLQFFI